MSPAIRSVLYGAVGAGLVLRVLCLLQSQKNPLLTSPVLDEAYYVAFGRAVASGFLLGENRVFFMDPLFGYITGFLFFLFGDSLNAIRIFHVAVDTANILLVYLVGAKVADQRVGLIGAIIYAGYKVSFFYTLLILKTTLTVTFSLIFVLFAIWVVSNKKIAGWAALGVYTAFAIWLRGNLILFAPMTLIVYWQVSRPDKKTLAKNSVIFCAALFLTLSVGAARNYYVAGEWVLQNSQAGRLLYSSNNSKNLTGLYNNPSFIKSGGVGGAEGAEREFHREAEKRTGRKMSAKEVSDYWMAEAWLFLATNKITAIKLLYEKVKWTIGAHEIPVNLSYYTATEFSSILRWPLPTFAFVFCLGAPGLVLAVKRRREALWLFVPVLTMMGTILIFYTSSRFRFPMVPFLCLGVGVTVTTLYSWISSEKRKSAISLAAGCITLLFLSLSVPSFTPSGNEEFLLAKSYWKKGDLTNAYALGNEGYAKYPKQARFSVIQGVLSLTIGQYDKAIIWSERAIALNPELSDPYHNLGLALLGKNNPEKAIVYLEKANTLAALPATLFALARAYEESGRINEARGALKMLLNKTYPADPLRVKAKAKLDSLKGASKRSE